jgi:hypothetical protein
MFKRMAGLAAVVAAVVLAQGCVSMNSGNTVSVEVAKKPAMTFQLPDKWSSKVWRNKTILIPPSKYPHIQLWCLEGVPSVGKAKAKVAKLVKSEVIKYKVVKKNSIVVAGKPGLHLIGKGLEADDQDPSNAEVFLFEVSGKIFLLCVHGEGDEAAKNRKAALGILATVRKP